MTVARAQTPATLTLIAATLLLAGAWPGSAREAGDDGKATEVWYQPSQADFRATYDRDAANAKLQTWDQYWGWVSAFYAGNLLSSGWTQRMSPEVAVVASRSTREALIGRLNRVGVRIAQEWAKEDAVRRINTEDLKRWHAAIGKARAAEDGSGDRIKAAIQAVEDEVARKLVPAPGPTPPPPPAPKSTQAITPKERGEPSPAGRAPLR